MATIADLGAEASRHHRDFGAGSLIVCDRLVRIYAAAFSNCPFGCSRAVPEALSNCPAPV